MRLKPIFLVCAVILCTYSTYAQTKDAQIEKRVEDLLSKMTLEEKIGQMNQISYFDLSESTLNGFSEGDLTKAIKKINPRGKGLSKPLEEMNKAEKITVLISLKPIIIQYLFENPLKSGNIGSLLNIVDPLEINRLQRIAVEETRLGIPMIIGRDVIHGFKTIFPIPLGQAASFDRAIVEQGARVAAIEAREKGVNWTFAPMLDISRDARWGRIAESLGEDTYLTSQLGAAMVKGFQGNDLTSESSLVACAKHFIGYGASEGGRDYNSTNIPEHLMHNVYLPPFKAAIDAGAQTLMTSFNDNDGIPASGNKYILKDLLRDQWKFDGFIVSDWASVGEMVSHGFAKDGKDAALLSVNAGLDMEMQSGNYTNYLKSLVDDGKVNVKDIDESVKNILRVKFRMGLFENPYVDTAKPSKLYAEEHLQAARKAAVKSAVLLKNDGVLPLKMSQKIAVIGPMADAPYDQLGTWVFDGDKNYTVTPVGALKGEYKHINYIYEPALKYSRDKNTSNFDKAKQAAASADVAVVFLGEEAILSGEAHSLSNINLIGVQSELLKAVKSAGKPVVLVIMAGRPLTIERDLPYADAVLYNFHPGTMGGPAIFDLLFGKANPSGKLPVTFVREVGQIPMYYNHNNTGRPAVDEVATLDKIPLEAGQTSLGNTSFYLDSGKDPLFPFGYGLSYSNFEYSDLILSADEIQQDETLSVKATVTNTSQIDGEEIIQLYIQDKVGSIVRPVKELKGFQRILIKAGESKVVEFKINSEDLAFYGINKKIEAEAGEFNIWIGKNSKDGLKGEFTLK